MPEEEKFKEVPEGLKIRWEDFGKAVRKCWARASEEGRTGKAKVGEYLSCWEELKK